MASLLPPCFRRRSCHAFLVSLVLSWAWGGSPGMAQGRLDNRTGTGSGSSPRWPVTSPGPWGQKHDEEDMFF